MRRASTNSRAIYTVLMGGYEGLKEVTTSADDHVDSICFTDDPTLTSDTWQIRLVKPSFPSDPVRSQRLLKIRGNELLDSYDTTLYVDNSVRLKVPAGTILDRWLEDPNVDIALPLHSYRETVLDEFDELIESRYDDPARLYEQLVQYSEDHAESLNSRPYWTAIVARRSNDRVRKSMAVWADHVLRYSRRDQLSARVALDSGNVSVNAVEIDNFTSDLHEWPVEVHRKVAQGKTSERVAGPLVADLRRLRRNLTKAQSAEESAVVDAANVRQRNVELEAAVRHYEAELAEFHASTSWRITAPLRFRLGRSGH
jgi:Protein of unknown function (DUF616)